MSFSYQPASGVLSGTSFETQTEAFLSRAAVGAFPASSGTSLSTSGASSAGGDLVSKNFTAPSAGWYSITCLGMVKITNNANGLSSNSVVAVDTGEGSCLMPVSKGQSVTIWWLKTQTPTMRFVAAVEA